MPFDINCDMGESTDAFRLDNDDAILDYVTSINIACGYHAGNHTIMHRTVRNAIRKKMSILAHTQVILMSKDLVVVIGILVHRKFTIWSSIK